MSEAPKEVLDLVEAQLTPLADEGSRATYMSVPVGQLSREALLGLVAWLGRNEVKRESLVAQERAMWTDIVRARRRG